MGQEAQASQGHIAAVSVWPPPGTIRSSCLETGPAKDWGISSLWRKLRSQAMTKRRVARLASAALNISGSATHFCGCRLVSERSTAIYEILQRQFPPHPYPCKMSFITLRPTFSAGIASQIVGPRTSVIALSADSAWPALPIVFQLRISKCPANCHPDRSARLGTSNLPQSEGG